VTVTPSSQQSGKSSGADARALAVLGLSDRAEELYRLLLEHPGLSVSDASGRSDVSTARIRDAFHELESRGLLTRSASYPLRFFPTSPELALGILVRQHEDDLDRVRAAIASYQARFAQATTRLRDPLHLVEVVLGREAVLQRVTQLQRAAQQEILVFDKQPYAATEEVTTAEIEHLRRGVRARVIYDRTALEIPGQVASLRRLAELGEEARVGDNLPTKMMIADRSHAIVPLDFDSPGVEGIVLVNASPLLDALAALFDSFWRVAIPVAWKGNDPTLASPPVDAHDRDLLTLLVAGHKDEAIAHQLGISRRTVQRRIRRLMDKIGANSRSQVILQAARRGLLAERDAVNSVPRS
jgi:sugar-specific transcriptional regulator TrmB/DNA-binding CsgD family transcriptional regulator